MLLIPFGILWFGYTVGLYGFCNIKGPGIGFADLILPSRIQHMNDQWATVVGGVITVPDNTNTGPAFPGNGTVINPGTGLTQAPPGWHYDPSKNIMVGP